MAEDALADAPRRRHHRSWVRRHRRRIFLWMMVLGAGLVCGGAVIVWEASQAVG